MITYTKDKASCHSFCSTNALKVFKANIKKIFCQSLIDEDNIDDVNVK